MVNYSILVNTTDTFSDCWIPFFSLFKKYWPDYTGKIYLNTEKKDFEYEGLNIICIKNSKYEKNKIKWGECLIRALDFIEEDIVLYMQEDYFIKATVQSDVVNYYSEVIENTDIKCIHLTDQATPGPFNKTKYPDLFEINRNAPYRLSTQAALWKKEVLIKHVKPFESGWLFEHFGTKRSRIWSDKFYIIDNSKYSINNNEIIPYVFTGIIKGKWNKDVPQLFANNNIVMDFSSRGFFIADIPLKRSANLVNHFKMIPSYIDLLKLTVWGK